ncbi:hypothetical protein SAMN05216573_13516 [Bradyrhizobium sp. Rc3b]|nr:hypothetical protein SAMN05216573_13516 [Bradyrhizobium sp. Rc3b]
MGGDHDCVEVSSRHCSKHLLLPPLVFCFREDGAPVKGIALSAVIDQLLFVTTDVSLIKFDGTDTRICHS